MLAAVCVLPYLHLVRTTVDVLARSLGGAAHDHSRRPGAAAVTIDSASTSPSSHLRAIR
jgi:hypothetical protein